MRKQKDHENCETIRYPKQKQYFMFYNWFIT